MKKLIIGIIATLLLLVACGKNEIDETFKGMNMAVVTDEETNWFILYDGKEDIGFIFDKDVKITWGNDVDKEQREALEEYGAEAIKDAKKIEVFSTKKMDLSEKERKEMDEDIKKWYWADSVKIMEIKESNGNEDVELKPVIYLYPKKTMDVNVQLDYKGTLTTTYPSYQQGGWNVTANPDGTLIDKATNKEYSYLFWEGESNVDYDMSEGFVIAGEDTAEFLQDKLSYMGLTPREYNEFIVFWLPQMQNNKYNLIKFQGEQYTQNAELKIAPKPDSMLRVFMTWKGLDEKVEVKEQKLEKFERKGFAVVEWGGSEIK